MYLKCIRAQGFKSFADKLNLEINSGITGIVGPNGSGKSNIVDAVRWVLGEQSIKSLRSSTMSDIIFNGSATREPLKRAMVALVFDNTDHYLNSEFNEIEVKRVVYNTGENEYYLNNSRVRLKDITDLFMESGAGNGAFNIISQGNVTDIVNSKSVDRRIYFESSAKVLKYKKRKEESLRKLEKTEENLLRINLIIKELEETVKPLEKESILAKKYLEIKNDLEAIDIALICHDITELNETYKNSQTEIEILKKSVEKNDSSVEDAKLEKLKATSMNIDDKINVAQEKLLNITKELANLNKDKQLTMERQKYNADAKSIDENLIKLKEEELNITKNKEILDKDITSLKDNLKKVMTDNEEVSNDIIKLKVERTNYQNDLATKNKNLFVLENNKEIIENNILNDSSSPLSVRNILNNPRLKGIHNTIGKLITVDDKYLIALDTALGFNKNFIVVDDEDAALMAIDYLKTNKLGRATFYPMNVIKGRYLNDEDVTKASKITGFIGLFKDLVKYEEKYQNIIDRELGSVIVVKDAEALKRIATLLNHKVKIVSLDGEIHNIGGSITGGTSKSSNIIYQKNELNKIKENINTLNIEIKSLNEEINLINKKIISLEEKNNELTKESININSLLATKEATLHDLEEKLTVVSSEKEGINAIKTNETENVLLTIIEEINVASKNKELLEKEISKLTEEKHNIMEEITIKEKEIKENNSLVNSKLNELKNKEVLLGKTEVKLDTLLRNLNEEYNITYEYAITNYALDIEEKIAREKVMSLKKELNKLGNVNVGAIDEYERLNTRYTFLTNQKEDLEKASSELKDIIKEMDEIMVDKFKTTFDKIKKEFARIYTLMFKGGHGELKLSDPDDLLNTGIDIISTPPGKKISSPVSLSGGEKALTAICLLFAMLEVNPAPFIILDEAEAALDEANVDMFGKYLNEEKNKSQFIVITHKKRMMEYVDTLYGITMQESGVSKIVSTKLENN